MGCQFCSVLVSGVRRRGNMGNWGFFEGRCRTATWEMWHFPRGNKIEEMGNWADYGKKARNSLKCP